MFRVGVISDTHFKDSRQKLPKQVIEDFKKTDMVIHCGDLVDLSVLQQLKKCCKNVYAVWGNMDPVEVKDALPEKEIIKIGNYRVGLIHGWGPPARLPDIVMEKFRDDNVDVIIFGHSHACMNEKRDGILLFNPGSATDTIFCPFNSYGIIEFNDKISAKIIRM